MIQKIRDLYRGAARWVHRQPQIVSSIAHGVICLVGVAGVGIPLGAIVASAAGQLAGHVTVGVLMVAAIVLYGAREERNRREKGFRQAARDGDTLFGPDFILAVAGAVAGFTIALAVLGV